MSNPIFKTPQFTFSPTFTYTANAGIGLIKVGLPLSYFENFYPLTNIIKGARIHTLSAYPKNVEFNGEISNWVDVELMWIPVNTEEPLTHDVFTQFCMLAQQVMGTAPFVVSELDLVEVALIRRPLFRSFNNESNTGEHPEYYPTIGIVFAGVQARHDLEETTLIRTITLHTSKETPVVTSYMPTGMVTPRKAAVVQFSPYPTSPNRLNAYAFGNTGEELVKEIQSTSLFAQTVPYDTLRILLGLTTLEQYRIARVLCEYKKLYGNLSVNVVSSVIENTEAYRDIITLLEQGYQPTAETLNALFAATPSEHV